MFVTCPECGAAVTDRNILMLARHFPWKCPECGAMNKPQTMPPGENPPLAEEPEVILTIEKGGTPTPGATPLFWNE
jgi:hypothetical protein